MLNHLGVDPASKLYSTLCLFLIFGSTGPLIQFLLQPRSLSAGWACFCEALGELFPGFGPDFDLLCWALLWLELTGLDPSGMNRIYSGLSGFNGIRIMDHHHVSLLRVSQNFRMRDPDHLIVGLVT